MSDASKPVTLEPKPGDKFKVPPLGSVMAFRGVHALSTIGANGYLKATHYATCLIGGREPMWGVWNVDGVFQRFFGSKDQIAKAYKHLTWRRRSATWNLIDVHNKDAEEKRKEMRTIYHKGQLLESGVAVAALFENGTVVPWELRGNHPGKFRPLYAGAAQEFDNVVHLPARKEAAVSS